MDPSSDRVAQALRLRRLHEAFHEGRPIGGAVRATVAQSWQRCGAAGLDPQHHLAPIVMGELEVAERWRAHPLRPLLPALRELLRDATRDAGHLLAISDADGVLMWIEGHRGVAAATEAMHFVGGADWSEAGAGTNALGTALAVGRPVQIFSAEHYNRRVHPWQCSAAPVRDPGSGDVIGVVDLTGHLRTVHPHTLALVTAVARVAEGLLREGAHERRGGRPGTAQPAHQPHAHAAPTLTLRLLTRNPTARVDGQVVSLTARHAELLTVLLLSPRGLSAEQLALHLHGERGKPVTVRAELSRLRRVLGAVVQGRPYRLAAGVEADLLDARRRLRDEGPGAALDGYDEPLLRDSSAPLVVEAREALDAELRLAVMSSGDAGLVARWCATESGADDLQAAELLLGLLPATDSRHPAALARARRLRSQFG